MAQKYKTIFFDLDHTLWDFEANSTATLLELISKYALQQWAAPETFIAVYQQINHQMWQLYYQHQIDKEILRLQRFVKTLAYFNINDDKLAAKLSDEYLAICPYKGQLFAHAHDVLENLQSKYQLFIITNGFREVQNIKINAAQLHRYFIHCIVSEDVGHLKPHAPIFEYAMQLAGSAPNQCLMIGDNYEADIVGAAGVGIDTVLFNAPQPNKLPSTYQVQNLKQLLQFL